jgi:hypothetical protein
MAVKDFIKKELEPFTNAVVCNADGRMFKMDKLSNRVANALVLGSDTYTNELGEQITYIWID